MNEVERAIAAVCPEMLEASPPAMPQPNGAGPIPEGQRNATLTKKGGQLRRLGYTEQTIRAALLAENRQHCAPPLQESEVARIAASVGRYSPGSHAGAPVPLVAYTVNQLREHHFPERRALFLRDGMPVFREGHLGQIYAERGVGKTWFSMTLALVAASGEAALGFTTPEPCRVLYVDGEMASGEIQERFALLCDRLRIPAPPTLTVVAADWQPEYLQRLDETSGQEALAPLVAKADLIILDNRSCLFDPEGEKDATAWQPAQDWLLSLRRAGKAVLVVHHANRQGGARGHSKAEDPMNLLIKLGRPADYSQNEGARFEVTFEKSRGAWGSAVSPFVARLDDEGWDVESAGQHREDALIERLVAYVREADRAGKRPKSANAAISGAGVSKPAGLKAWRAATVRERITQRPDGTWAAT